MTTHRKRKDVRVDLPRGGHILFKPAGTRGRAVAQRAAVAALAEGEDEAVVGVVWTIALACWGLISWEGIYEAPDDDAPEDAQPVELPATAANLEALLEAEPDVFTAVDGQYGIPALELEKEKNGFAPSPAGTSQG
jgi:ABC-type Fe3+-hydroxamate transport system substrate-binding protein